MAACLAWNRGERSGEKLTAALSLAHDLRHF
jgi:hypothetical protein